MRRFWLFLHGLTALSQVPFAIGLHFALTALGAPGWLAVAAAVAAGALLALLIRVPIRRAVADRHHGGPARMLAEELYYVHWCAGIGAVVLFAVGLVGLAAAWAARGAVDTAMASAGAAAPAGPAASVGALAAGCYGVTLCLALYGVLVRRRWVRVRELEVSIPGLPEAFDGYRIAQLSDLHVGSMCPRERVEGWVRRTNALEPDLVALTGDYVTSGVAFHEDIAGALGQLRARDGVAAVMGNHDYFGDGEPLVELLRAAGIRVLRNEHTVLTRGDARLTLAGVDDVWTRRADVARTVAGRDPSIPMVVLAHDPALFPRFAARGAALVLSGHTHWGQVAGPLRMRRFNLARLAFRFHADVYREGDATLYVHPGMGTTGPPVRLGAPPEIAVIRLRRAEGTAKKAA